jgi:MerR family redox-sensitive transcriptional activator SoxR
MSGGDTLSIGALSAETGVAISALRYYDELDLVSASRVGGKRRFSHSTVGRVNFIRRAKQAGFSLAEIGEILDDRSGAWASTVDQKVAALRQRQVELAKMIDLLDEVRQCDCAVVAECERLIQP